MRDRVLAITRNLADTYAVMDRPDLTEPLLVELAKGGGATSGGGGDGLASYSTVDCGADLLDSVVRHRRPG